jgi:phosphopantothenoylcysteine decarboxylase/phosphopantothenate--cysteine ligase
VADFRPARPEAGKIKKGANAPDAILLEPTPDILAELGAREGARPVLVGFAAETSDVERHAREKLASKRVDLIVANDVSDPSLGFGTADNRVLFVSAEGTEELPVMPKQAIARALLDRVRELLG